MLTQELMKQLVEDKVLKALSLRYDRWTESYLLDYNVFTGNIKITTTIPSGNWGGITSSLRGIKEMHVWLDSIDREFQTFSRMLMGWYKPTEEFNKDINWKERRPL